MQVKIIYTMKNLEFAEDIVGEHCVPLTQEL